MDNLFYKSCIGLATVDLNRVHNILINIENRKQIVILKYKADIAVNSTLAVSNIRNRTYTNCEVYLIDYGYGNFKEKIHFME